jgi:hypothetical protein
VGGRGGGGQGDDGCRGEGRSLRRGEDAGDQAAAAGAVGEADRRPGRHGAAAAGEEGAGGAHDLRRSVLPAASWGNDAGAVAPVPAQHPGGRRGVVTASNFRTFFAQRTGLCPGLVLDQLCMCLAALGRYRF